jgi:hypothetical protein
MLSKKNLKLNSIVLNRNLPEVDHHDLEGVQSSKQMEAREREEKESNNNEEPSETLQSTKSAEKRLVDEHSNQSSL